jgi:hypothetical protein
MERRKRACDGCVYICYELLAPTNCVQYSCHTRKVKCDKNSSCGRCKRAGRICAYDSIPQKKGPKIKKPHAPRKLLQQKQAAQSTPSYQRCSNSGGLDVFSEIARLFGHIGENLVENCINWFFDRQLNRTSILNRGDLRQAAKNMQSSPEEYCMILALCAYVTLFAETEPSGGTQSGCYVDPSASATVFNQLLAECVQVRNSYNYQNHPTNLTVLTSWLVSCCYLKLQQPQVHFLYLYEGIAQAALLGKAYEQTLLDWLFPLKQSSWTTYTMAQAPWDTSRDPSGWFSIE